MGRPCYTCNAPTVIRDLIERLRSVNISYRDCALVVKTIRNYDISHAAIQRHEIDGHYDPNIVLASQVPDINPEELTLKTIVDHKLRLWWGKSKDEVPTSNEVRAWFKLLADLSEAESDREKTKMLREAFSRPALPSGEEITVKVLDD